MHQWINRKIGEVDEMSSIDGWRKKGTGFVGVLGDVGGDGDRALADRAQRWVEAALGQIGLGDTRRQSLRDRFHGTIRRKHIGKLGWTTSYS